MGESTTETAMAEELHRLRARVAELEQAAASRKQVETTLRESEQLYRSLVETSPDSIVVTDLEGRVLMANQRTVALHGYSAIEEVLGIDVLQLVAEEDREEAAREIRKIVETGGVRDHHHGLRRKDGSTFLGEVSGSLIRGGDDEPKYILYNGRDITARVRMQNELAETQKLESIGRLAGGIAHDFNNLLAVILGNASLQLRNRDLPKKTLDCLEDIVQAAERASSLTTQLLAYARGGLRRAAPTDLNKVVAAAWELVRRSAPKGTDCDVILAQELPSAVVDPAQIQQVVINLLLNAVQAGGDAPGRIELRTSVAELDKTAASKAGIAAGSYAVIRVRDHGHGMDPAVVARVFEPFFTTRPEGRGMGLPAAVGIVEAHKGRLLIDSEPGQGTDIAVWLPLNGSRDVGERCPESGLHKLPQGHETVLVVEQTATARLTEQMLAALGYCVVTRCERDEALAFLDTNCEDIDLVVLNPGIARDGLTAFVEQLRRCCPPVPFLLIGDAETTDIPPELADLGAAGFLARPFSLMGLGRAVRGALDASVAAGGTSSS